jgi:hypothetical protein
VRTVKIYLYEVISALALLGIAQFYFLDDNRLLAFAKILTLGLYVMIAVATEALIASALQPGMLRVVSVNLLVAAVISAPGWTTVGVASLTNLGVVAVATFILRLGAATFSLKAQRITVNRAIAALVGSTLVLEILTTAYSTIEGIYYDDFVYPKVKPGYIVPTSRWQYFADQIVFWSAAALLLYLSYRLLKYAFCAKPTRTA